MIEMTDTEVSQGDRQVMDENEQIFNTYIQTLHEQCATICQTIHPDDIMEKFYREIVMYSFIRKMQKARALIK